MKLCMSNSFVDISSSIEIEVEVTKRGQWFVMIMQGGYETKGVYR